MGAIRGAICLENTVADIEEKATELIGEILTRNNLQPCDIDAIFFSATQDITAAYPAKAVRERFGMKNVAFMCFAEMNVEGSLPHCLRVCVFSGQVSQSKCVHVYIGEARGLRGDLS